MRDDSKMKGANINSDSLEPSGVFLCMWKNWSGNSRHS